MSKLSVAIVAAGNDIAQMREREDELYAYDAWTTLLAVHAKQESM